MRGQYDEAVMEVCEWGGGQKMYDRLTKKRKTELDFSGRCGGNGVGVGVVCGACLCASLCCDSGFSSVRTK